MRFRIRILLLFKLTEIFDHCSIGPSASILSFMASIQSVYDPPRLYFEPQKFLNFDFNADPDPAFHSKANPDQDPDPA